MKLRVSSLTTQTARSFKLSMYSKGALGKGQGQGLLKERERVRFAFHTEPFYELPGRRRLTPPQGCELPTRTSEPTLLPFTRPYNYFIATRSNPVL